MTISAGRHSIKAEVGTGAGGDRMLSGMVSIAHCEGDLGVRDVYDLEALNDSDVV